jgi:hypothetical protein
MLKRMKIFPIMILSLYSIISQAQTDSTFEKPKRFTNSCESYFKRKNILTHGVPLNYSYDIPTQTHNYSGNWDFDADGATDSLFFIGTGGAHLYFYLRIVLSSDRKVRDFNFINLDRPCLGSIEDLKNADFYSGFALPQFVVGDFKDHFYQDAWADIYDKIFLRLDQFSIPSRELKRRGITSQYLLLEYKNGELVFKDFFKY